MIHVQSNFDSEKNEWGRVLENKRTIHRPYFFTFFDNEIEHNMKTT